MNSVTLEERVVGAYLGLAVGDALGATVEFMTPREILTLHQEHRDIVGGGWLKLAPGRVTDDTEMSLALGDAILGFGPFDATAVGRSFDNWMRSRPVDIGSTVRRGILEFRNKRNTEVPPNEHDGGNGACMRTLPVAIATLGMSDEAVVEATRVQAHLTHNNPLSDAGTVAVVRMLQAFFKGATRVDVLHGEVRALVNEEPDFAFRRRREENPSGFIVHTLRAVFQALFDTDTFEECLVDVVNRGGDADTTGAIAGMLAGAAFGNGAIPKRWLKKLDRDVQAQCETQARALLACATQRQFKEKWNDDAAERQ